MLCIDYVNSLGSRPYQYTSSAQVNCMGYALDVRQWIEASDMGFSSEALYGKTLGQMFDFVCAKVEDWMFNTWGPTAFYSLSSYDANVNSSTPGWYRVALRVGFKDDDHNGIYNKYESWDFHWWYQTNSSYGCWAEKNGGRPSELLYGTNGVDPESDNWTFDDWIYNSDCKYYQIKDLRAPDWQQEDVW